MNLQTATMRGVRAPQKLTRGKLIADGLAPAVGLDLAGRAEKAAAVAAEHAVAVDRDSRFPAEAIAAVRAARLLGTAVPLELGGEGASIADVADVCYVLGRSCASTAMIYAMHQTKVACIARHGTVRSAQEPTACMSFNNHRDHFGATWNLRLVGGGVAHTGCVAFGIDRLTLALFATHGLDLPHWPIAVRKALGI